MKFLLKGVKMPRVALASCFSRGLKIAKATFESRYDFFQIIFFVSSRLQYAWSAFPCSNYWKLFVFWISVRRGYILISFRNRSSKNSNFWDTPSKTGSEAVSAFVIESRLADGIVCCWGANRIFDVEGRSFCCWLCVRCYFGRLVG